MGEVDRTPERGSQQQGKLIVRVNVFGTVIFVATAAFAAAAFTTTAQWIGASTAMALFAVGVFAFLWGFWNAVQRSRDEEVSVTRLLARCWPPCADVWPRLEWPVGCLSRRLREEDGP